MCVRVCVYLRPQLFLRSNLKDQKHVINKCAYAIFSEITPEVVGEMFYNGELELELHRIGLDDYRFKLNSDRELFQASRGSQADSLYPDPKCFQGCKERGQ